MAKITIIIEDFEFPPVKAEAKPVYYTKADLPYKGELVLVRDSNEESWKKAYFQKYESDVPYPWCMSFGVWAQCAKYDERLLS